MDTVATRRFKSALTAAGVGGLILASLAPAAFAAARPRAPFAVAAVFPPWWDEARIDAAAAASGQETARGAFDNIVILYGDAAVERAALRAGALVVLDPTLAGCRQS